MSLFDSIIRETNEKFGLGNKAGSLLSALLALLTDKNRGGFTGFLDSFNNAGLSNLVSSWVGSGRSETISNEQIEKALGTGTIREIANQAGVDNSAATSALAFMTPKVVDTLTPNGVIPEETDLLSKIGNYITGVGGAVLGGVGAAGAAASGAFNKATDTVKNTVKEDRPITENFVDGGAPVQKVEREPESSGGSILKWLIPLILLGLIILLAYNFCGRSTVAPANTNTNVNRNTNVAVNTSPTATSAATGTPRTLTEVVLPNGTKLQAYPGGIEDQLVKFIQSDEYKNGTADSLKNKWFSFDDLNFEFGKTTLVPESKRQLDNIEAILKAFPAVKIKVAGYTDKKGDDAANKKLSDDRAKAVQAALAKAGVGAQVPEAEGYGEEFATVPETAGDKEREADRKTSVRLIK